MRRRLARGGWGRARGPMASSRRRRANTCARSGHRGALGGHGSNSAVAGRDGARGGPGRVTGGRHRRASRVEGAGCDDGSVGRASRRAGAPAASGRHFSYPPDRGARGARQASRESREARDTGGRTSATSALRHRAGRRERVRRRHGRRDGARAGKCSPGWTAVPDISGAGIIRRISCSMLVSQTRARNSRARPDVRRENLKTCTVQAGAR